LRRGLLRRLRLPLGRPLLRAEVEAVVPQVEAVVSAEGAEQAEVAGNAAAQRQPRLLQLRDGRMARSC
jgi:hypothetical protein